MKKLTILSKVPDYAIPMHINVDKVDYSSYVYMCIKEANTIEFHIPDNILGVVNEVLNGVYRTSDYLYHNDYRYNCYVTIKRGYVQPHTYGNRAGWHIDGFKSDQHNFMWFDSMPTEVCEGEFVLSDDHNLSLYEMDTQSFTNDTFIHTLSPNTLYEMNQECVHRPTVNKTSDSVLRTFIKITFSKDMFNGFGNAWNYKLPHIKPNKKRKVERNHTVV